MQKTLDFWFEFASPYSYPAAMRIEQLAEQVGVKVRWRVFLLGAVFQQYGWKNTPDKLFPAKGEYMWHDMKRLCESADLAYQKPVLFPANGLLAARICAHYADQPWIAEFTRLVYQANFAHGSDIGNPDLLVQLLEQVDQNSADVMTMVSSDEGKQALKNQTQQALQHDVFGAPFILVGDEPFWGNDRLEQAIYFAAHGKLPTHISLS